MSKKKQLSVNFKSEVLEAIENFSNENGIKKSNVIEKLVETALRNGVLNDFIAYAEYINPNKK